MSVNSNYDNGAAQRAAAEAAAREAARKRAEEAAKKRAAEEAAKKRAAEEAQKKQAEEAQKKQAEQAKQAKQTEQAKQAEQAKKSDAASQKGRSGNLAANTSKSTQEFAANNNKLSGNKGAQTQVAKDGRTSEELRSERLEKRKAAKEEASEQLRAKAEEKAAEKGNTSLLSSIGSAISDGIESLGAGVNEALDAAGDAVESGANRLAEGVDYLASGKAVEDLVDAGQGLINDVVDGAQAVGNGVVDGAQKVGNGIADGVQAAHNFVVDGTQAVGNFVVDGAQNLYNGAVDGGQAVNNAVVDGVQAAHNFVADGAQAIGNSVIDGAQAVNNGIIDVAQGGANGFLDGVQEALGNVVPGFEGSFIDNGIDFLQGGANAVVDGQQQFHNQVVDGLQGAGNFVADGVQNLYNGAVDGAQGLVNGAIDLNQQAVNGAVDGAQGLVNGAVDGIQAFENGVADGVQGVVNGVIDGAQAVGNGVVDVAQGGVNGAIDGVQKTVSEWAKEHGMLQTGEIEGGAGKDDILPIINGGAGNDNIIHNPFTGGTLPSSSPYSDMMDALAEQLAAAQPTSGAFDPKRTDYPPELTDALAKDYPNGIPEGDEAPIIWEAGKMGGTYNVTQGEDGSVTITGTNGKSQTYTADEAARLYICGSNSDDNIIVDSNVTQGMNIIGGGGNDFIHGGSGDDNIYDYSGNNVIRGGAGDDTATTRESGSPLIGVHKDLKEGIVGGVGSLIVSGKNDIGDDVEHTHEKTPSGAIVDTTSAESEEADSVAGVLGGIGKFILDQGPTSAAFDPNRTDYPPELADALAKDYPNGIPEGDDAPIIWEAGDDGGTYNVTQGEDGSITITGTDGKTQTYTADEAARLYMCGGEGNDNIIVDSNVTQGMNIIGGGGNDFIHGGSGDDNIYDYSGVNVIRGGAGDDTATTRAPEPEPQPIDFEKALEEGVDPTMLHVLFTTQQQQKEMKELIGRFNPTSNDIGDDIEHTREKTPSGAIVDTTPAKPEEAAAAAEASEAAEAAEAAATTEAGGTAPAGSGADIEGMLGDAASMLALLRTSMVTWTSANWITGIIPPVFSSGPRIKEPGMMPAVTMCPMLVRC